MVLEDSGGEDVLLPFNIASSISEEFLKNQFTSGEGVISSTFAEIFCIEHF